MEGLEVSRAFWQGKRVFITGHTGFKGSWLCRWLLHLGADISGYALAPATTPNLYDEAELGQNIRWIEADVRDPDRLRAAISAHKSEVVFHLAAQSLVYDSFTRPIETYETNVMGTANLLEAMRAQHGIRAAVIVTSDKCYLLGDPTRRYSEDDPLGGGDPYSSSKACAEYVTAAYRSSFFSEGPNGALSQTAVATARAGNVIGGGDWSPHRLIPDAVAAFGAGKPLLLRNPGAIRPWQHVLDPLNAYLLLAQRLWDHGREYAGAWNFGPPPTHELTVEALIREFAGAWGQTARWQIQPVAGFHEAGALRLNSDRAESKLGWHARVQIGQALRTTAEWYKAQLRGENARALVDAEIAGFEEARAL